MKTKFVQPGYLELEFVEANIQSNKLFFRT